MEIIKERKYLRISFDNTKQILETNWLGNNADITEEEIKETIYFCANSTKQYKPKYYLANNKNRQFPYSIDIQNWVATTLAVAGIEAGVEKFGIVMPTELIAELSTEQTADEAESVQIEIKYFENKSDAMQWILD